jgi:hypothetical protein
MAQKAEKTNEQLSGVSSSALLEYLQFTQILCDYYDNEMKANTGDYADDNSTAFNAASEKFTKYLNVQRRVFNEIERRVNEIC